MPDAAGAGAEVGAEAGAEVHIANAAGGDVIFMVEAEVEKEPQGIGGLTDHVVHSGLQLFVL